MIKLHEIPPDIPLSSEFILSYSTDSTASTPQDRCGVLQLRFMNELTVVSTEHQGHGNYQTIYKAKGIHTVVAGQEPRNPKVGLPQNPYDRGDSLYLPISAQQIEYIPTSDGSRFYISKPGLPEGRSESGATEAVAFVMQRSEINTGLNHALQNIGVNPNDIQRIAVLLTSRLLAAMK